MRNMPVRLNGNLQASPEEPLGRRDAWMFAPLVAIVVALPLAIVTILGASIWFATHSSDQYRVASFESRFSTVYTR